VTAAFDAGVFCDFFTFSLVLLIFHVVAQRLYYFRLHYVSLISVSHPPLFMSVPITSGVWFISVEVGSFVWMRLNFSPSCSKAQSSNCGPDSPCLPTFFFFGDFSQINRQSCVIVQYSVPLTFNSMSFPVPASLLILSFHAVGCNPTYLRPRSVNLK
jgi:hypothetical protein